MDNQEEVAKQMIKVCVVLPSTKIVIPLVAKAVKVAIDHHKSKKVHLKTPEKLIKLGKGIDKLEMDNNKEDLKKLHKFCKKNSIAYSIKPAEDGKVNIFLSSQNLSSMQYFYEDLIAEKLNKKEKPLKDRVKEAKNVLKFREKAKEKDLGKDDIKKDNISMDKGMDMGR